MDKLIFSMIILGISGLLNIETEKLKYERYKKEKESKNRIIKKIYHTINQLINSIYNQTQASYNIIRKKEKILYLSPGDHIAIDRYFPIPYTHHGIFVGNNQVIHYVPPGIIKLTLLNEFRYYSDGYIYKVESKTNLNPDQIIKLAYSKIGEKNYDYIMNNCETFARICRYDERKI